MKHLDSFVAVDTETTGLDPEQDRLIEVAAVRFESGTPVAHFQALLAPGKKLSAVSRLITGLEEKELEGAPPAAETLRAFVDFVGELPLAAHNAEFDEAFLRRALEAEGIAAPPGPWIDSLLLSRIAWPGWESHRLDFLAGRIEAAREGEHRALPDARRAGHVLFAARSVLAGTLSETAWRDCARVAEGLPDWSLVFPEARPAVEGPPAFGAPESGRTREADGSEESPRVREVAERAAAALASETWLALETPPEMDEILAGLRAAERAASEGQRVLLCLPDGFAWNALRKHPAAAGSSVRVVALAEPSGYLSRARLRAVAANPARLPLEERAALLPLIAWADRADGPVADGRGFSPERNRLLWSRVCCDTYADDPAAQSARAAADSAGVILVTHATLCRHLRRDGALLPACDSVVVAGAHRLPEAALRAFGREVSFFRLREALQLLRLSPERDGGLWVELEPFLPEGERSWRERWGESERRLQKLLQKAGRHAGKRRPAGDSRVPYRGHFGQAFEVDPAPVLEALREEEDFLRRCAELPGAEALSGELLRVHARLHAFRMDLERLCEARDAESVHWFEDVGNPHKAALRSAPIGMEPFGEKLRELFGGGAFLSPALLAGGQGRPDARYFLGTIGMEDAGSVTTARVSGDTPAPRFLMAPFAPGFSAPEPPETFARLLVAAAQDFAGSGVFVFCPTQGALRAVAHALRPLLPPGTPLWVQHVDGNREAILRLYAAGRGGWLLATEGLAGVRDADGNPPALAVIARMPLPPAHDPVLEARGEILRAQDRNARKELWHPAAVLRLKKEIAGLRREGRGPRVLWLLDGRASAEGLGAHAARAMDLRAETVAGPEALRAATAGILNPEGKALP